MIIVLFAKSQVSHHLPESRSRPINCPTSIKKHHFMQKPIFSPTKLFLVGLILTTAWISGDPCRRQNQSNQEQFGRRKYWFLHKMMFLYRGWTVYRTTS